MVLERQRTNLPRKNRNKINAMPRPHRKYTRIHIKLTTGDDPAAIGNRLAKFCELTEWGKTETIERALERMFDEWEKQRLSDFME